MSEETLNEVLTGDLQTIECLAIDIRDAINSREDSEEIISYLYEMGLTFSEEFCRRKRPTPPRT